MRIIGKGDTAIAGVAAAVAIFDISQVPVMHSGVLFGVSREVEANLVAVQALFLSGRQQGR